MLLHGDADHSAFLSLVVVAAATAAAATDAYSCSVPGTCDGVNMTAINAIIDYGGANGVFAQYGDVYGPYYS